MNLCLYNSALHSWLWIQQGIFVLARFCYQLRNMKEDFISQLMEKLNENKDAKYFKTLSWVAALRSKGKEQCMHWNRCISYFSGTKGSCFPFTLNETTHFTYVLNTNIQILKFFSSLNCILPFPRFSSFKYNNDISLNFNFSISKTHH